MVKQSEVLNALKNIIDPDLGRDIVSLGFVKDLQIKNHRVSFAIELTTPACPVKEEFKAKAEELVGRLDEVTDVSVTLTSQKSAKGFNPKVSSGGANKVERFIAVASCKGGVGKSTIASSLAKEIAKRGHRVGLLDADIFGPSVPLLFGLQGSHLKITGENKLLPAESEGVKIISFGFLAGEAPAVMRGPMVSKLCESNDPSDGLGRTGLSFH